MKALETITIDLNHGYSVEVAIYPDEDCENPNDWGSGQVFNARRGQDLVREAKKTFGCYGWKKDEDDDSGWQAALVALESGEVVQHEGNYYLGFEEYRHSGSAYALCSNRGNFPDRRWDVIPLAGWVKWEKRELDGWLLKDRELDEETLKGATKSVLESWRSFVNGECYGYVVTLSHEKEDGYTKEVAEDSCWGFLGDMDYCKEQAMEAVNSMVENNPDAGPVNITKWEDYE